MASSLIFTFNTIHPRLLGMSHIEKKKQQYADNAQLWILSMAIFKP